MNNSFIPGEIYVKIGDEIQKTCRADNLKTIGGETSVFDSSSRLIMDCSLSFETLGKISEQAMLKIFGMWDMVVEACPNKRVRHLAKHARKERTQKKNVHRCFRMIERSKSHV